MNLNDILIRDAGKLRTKIDTIARTGRKLDESIHSAAVSALFHAKEHNDITLFNRLCEAMPRGSRVEGLIFWASSHAPVSKVSGQTMVKLKKKRTEADYSLEAAAQVPFYEYKSEKTHAQMTLEKMLGSLVRAADKFEDDATKSRALEAVNAALEAVGAKVDDTGKSKKVVLAA